MLFPALALFPYLVLAGGCMLAEGQDNGAKGPTANTGQLQEMDELSSKTSPIDPDLLAWKNKHTGVTPLQELSNENFEKLISGSDEVTAAFLELRMANISNKRQQATAVKNAITVFEANRGPNGLVQTHPMGAYLAEELLESASVPPSLLPTLEKELISSSGRSCPQRGAIMRAISDQKLKELDVPSLLELIARIQAYRSKSFREEAFASILDSVSSENQDSIRTVLRPLVRDFGKLISEHDWLFSDSPEDMPTKASQSPVQVAFDHAEKISRGRQCNTAKDHFEKGLAQVRNGQYFDRAESVGRKIEACYRRGGNKLRVKFWSQITKPMQDAYGFAGKEIALRRQGLILWSMDDFQQARKIFTELLEQSRVWNDKTAESNAVYTLARVEENQNNHQESIRFYEEYLRKFPQGENIEEIETSLVLLKSIVGDLPGALGVAETIIADQDKLSIDARSTQTMSFALFWAARLRLALGEREKAAKLWQRVATEYYSTFYGAIGHYMLEKTTGKSFALFPSKTKRFSMSDMMEEFTPDEKRLMERADLLVALGLKQDALCELGEIDIKDDKPAKVAMKSLLQFAAGDWLQAVKSYDALPRSLRNNLPVGFERILFPKAYEDSIEEYADSLGVDPEFVLAIIRQESVFNPKAKSLVGASGLMQLMPRTARMESQRLMRNYLTPEKRNQYRRISQRDDSIFNADFNLAIGVHHVHRLLQIYKNPVFILTSYNANPGATKRWSENIPTDDFLVFIERIPYQETRQYVRLVLRNYFYYKRWYNKPGSSYPLMDQVLAVDVARLNGSKGI